MKPLAQPSSARPRRLDLAGLLRDPSGATAIEYALLAAVLAIMAIGGLQAMMGGAGGLYATLQQISAAIEVALAR